MNIQTQIAKVLDKLYITNMTNEQRDIAGSIVQNGYGWWEEIPQSKYVKKDAIFHAILSVEAELERRGYVAYKETLWTGLPHRVLILPSRERYIVTVADKNEKGFPCDSTNLFAVSIFDSTENDIPDRVLTVFIADRNDLFKVLNSFETICKVLNRRDH